MFFPIFFVPLQPETKRDMLKRLILTLLTLLLTTVLPAQRREVHILAVNDIHSAMEAMPKLAYIADSLRTLYPDLLVLSAGDNRTGNPINDSYEIPGYPMVALMNQIGFNASAVGNHEFDANSLAPLCPLSTFPYLCANMTAAKSTNIRTQPYKLFDVDGVKVGIIGAVQITPSKGTPDAHPDFLRGIQFESPFDVIPRYKWLSNECDVTILLSHVGYTDDIKLAEQCPWLDLIVGGHSHRQLSEEEPLHNGVLITHNRNTLSQATHITLVVDSGRLVSKSADYVMVSSLKQKNKLVEAMVKTFNENPYFKRVLAHAETPFQMRNEVGTMVCDAMMSETGADVAIMNYRGVRVRRLPAGDITVHDALEIDPFGNNAVMMTMKGDMLEKFIIEYGNMNVYHFPHLGGMSAKIRVDQDDPSQILGVTLQSADGKRFDKNKTYRIVTNTYVIATAKKYVPAELEVLEKTTSDMIMTYLQKQKTVDYLGKGRLHYLPVMAVASRK